MPYRKTRDAGSDVDTEVFVSIVVLLMQPAEPAQMEGWRLKANSVSNILRPKNYRDYWE